MKEENLKTSFKQRLTIAIIAAILLGSSVAVYVAIIVGNGKNSTTSSEAQLDAIITEYSNKQEEIANALSSTYFEQLSSYRSEIKGFNADSANSAGLQTRDLVEGDDTEIAEDFSNYYAYYIGYCADETIFDSSFDSKDNPTALLAPLDVSSMSLIEGWTAGMQGAKVGGVREITMPGELAYGDTSEICGGYNSPLRFIVMTINPSEEILAKYKELDEIYERYVSAYYDYYYSRQDSSTGTVTTTETDAADTATESSEASE